MPVLTSDTALRDLLTGSGTIAVVGLSDNPDRDSNVVARYLQSHGYTIIPVNPTISFALDIPAVPTLDSIRQKIDIVDVFRRPEFLPDIVAAAIRIRARAIWMQPGTAHASAAETAAAAGLQVVVHHCIMVDHRRLVP
jgi:hypothetical protein